jgi:hypothetical protein
MTPVPVDVQTADAALAYLEYRTDGAWFDPAAALSVSTTAPYTGQIKRYRSEEFLHQELLDTWNGLPVIVQPPPMEFIQIVYLVPGPPPDPQSCRKFERLQQQMLKGKTRKTRIRSMYQVAKMIHWHVPANLEQALATHWQQTITPGSPPIEAVPHTRLGSIIIVTNPDDQSHSGAWPKQLDTSRYRVVS